MRPLSVRRLLPAKGLVPMPSSAEEAKPPRGPNAVIWAAWKLLRPSWRDVFGGSDLEMGVPPPPMTLLLGVDMVTERKD